MPAQSYRYRASAMRQEAERAETDVLRATYAGMAKEWDAMAHDAEIDQRLKN